MRSRRKIKNILSNKILYVIIAILGTVTLSHTLSFSNTVESGSVAYTNSFVSFLLCLFSMICFTGISERVDTEDNKGWIFSGIYSLGLSTALIVGKQLETVENFNITNGKSWFQIVILMLYFTPFIKIAWEWIEEKIDRKWKEEEGNHTVMDFLRNWVIIFLCWIPVFLAFYPGAFVYDAQDEYVQVATRMFTTHHPLAHVLLLGGFVCAGNKFFGSYNIGIAAYTLFQMLVLSAVFSYTVFYIKTKIKQKWVEKAAVLFYGLFPVVPMYAVCSAKDGLFTGAFLVVVIQMLLLFENPDDYLSEKKNWFIGIFASVIMMLFRNNGCYAYIVWMVFAVIAIICLKQEKEIVIKTTVFSVLGVVVFLLCSKTLAVAVSAEAGGSQEIMTVPIQQMVRTYVYSPETYREEEKELLFELISEEEMHVYNPRLSDIIKSKFDNEKFNADKGKYLALWLKIGIRKPLIYLNGWMMTSYGFWYPDAVINVYKGNTVHTFTYEESSYFGFETENPGVRESKFPWLEEQYRKMSLELYQQKVPGISMLFSPGFLFWSYAFCMGYFFWKEQWKKIIPLFLIFLLWGTVLLGPTYLVRYVLILWFALPVFVTEIKM